MTAEQLDAIQSMAERLVHPRLIAVAVGLDEDQFSFLVNDRTTDVSEHYYAGFIQAKIQLHESIIKSAMNGSNPSQAEMKKLINDAENYLNG